MSNTIPEPVTRVTFELVIDGKCVRADFVRRQKIDELIGERGSLGKTLRAMMRNRDELAEPKPAGEEPTGEDEEPDELAEPKPAGEDETDEPEDARKARRRRR